MEELSDICYVCMARGGDGGQEAGRLCFFMSEASLSDEKRRTGKLFGNTVGESWFGICYRWREPRTFRSRVSLANKKKREVCLRESLSILFLCNANVKSWT